MDRIRIQLEWRDRVDVVHDKEYDVVDSWTFTAPDGLSRDDIAEALLELGFLRIDNYQDHLEPLDN